MGLAENIHRDPLTALPLRPYAVVRSAETVRLAVMRMRCQRVGAVIVTGPDGRPEGMFNEKLLIRLLAQTPGVMEEPVERVMTRQIVTLERSRPIADLLEVMRRRQQRWVVVVDEAGRPVALTGLRGVIEYVADHFPRHVLAQPIESKLALRQREGA